MPHSAISGTDDARTRDCLRSLISKQVVPLGLLVIFALVIIQKASELDFASIFSALNAISPTQWAISIGGAVLSFWAIGRMDLVVHRIMGTGVSATVAQMSGIASVAAAQLTGFGLLTGTLARWRTLPDFTLWQVTKITGAVSAGFMGSLAVLCAVMVLLVGPDIPGVALAAAIAVCLALCLVFVSLWRPRALFRIRLPSLRAKASLLAFAFIDTGAAALALYILIPEAQMPPPAVFYTVFLLALGAGLLGTTPGGVGPFEMMFLACLPGLPEAPLLAAIMGYRMVYFALPAVLAVALLIAGPALGRRARREPDAAKKADPRQSPRAHILPAARAETGLVRQGEFDLLRDSRNRPVSIVAEAGQSLIMLSDPLRTDIAPETAIDTLHTAARHKFLTPCLYKCSARTARAAMQAGWWAMPVADEAILAPQDFHLDVPARRQLRRQLRKAETAGVVVTEAGARLPLDEMRRVALEWAAHRGTPRGFSMGRFDEDYVCSQRVWLARRDMDLLAFATMHEGQHERSLDLMCHTAEAPAGTMHLLVTQAIRAAQNEGCPRVSLAAVPRNLARSLPIPPVLADRIDRITGAAGLVRFKSSFAPDWEPLVYLRSRPVRTGAGGYRSGGPNRPSPRHNEARLSIIMMIMNLRHM